MNGGGDGRLRASQLITTYGPGAMVDLPEDSVLIAGLDSWKYRDDQIPSIEEPRLAAKLAKLLGRPYVGLRAPPPAKEDYSGKPYIVAWRFPEWFIVQEAAASPSHPGWRRRRLVHLSALEKGRKYRGSDRKVHPVVPIRFVRACKKGHVGDIDWKAFVHLGTSGCNRDLWLEERGTSGDLKQIWVVCECGAERAMSQAARLESRPLGHCEGDRPWLGPRDKEPCGEPNRLLIRSASNAYFPQLLSVISIPDTRDPVDALVRGLWDDFLSDVTNLEELVRIRRKPTVAQRLQGLDDGVVYAAIQRVRRGEDSEDRPVKEVEFDALTQAGDDLGEDRPEGDFFARTLPAEHWRQPWMDGVERVVLVHRLREVVAQVGFSRFEAIGPDEKGELDLGVQTAPLALDADWLPAVENPGEGVFLQFNSTAVRQWLERTEVQRREVQLLEGFRQWQREHETSRREFPGLPYVLLHSLAHMLLTSISLECGYPASALRERIYALSGNRYGVLIYTGAADAEGTLGGLVLAGRDIARHLARALELGRLCSNDPVCAHHVPAPHDQQPLHGAACHGCLLIAETSCEQRNEFLDRALIVSTVEGLGAEFFI
jgi:hypothetical protein